MLKFIVGPDKERAQARAKELASFPLREVLREEEFSIASLSAKASEQTLFGDTRVYSIDGELTEGYAKELILIAPLLLSSPHLFIFETEGRAPLVKLLEKTKGEVIKVKAPPKEKTFDVFSLANAYAARDKKKLWMLFQESLENEVQPEALVGILAWKARSVLAQKGPTDVKAVEQSSALIRMYHDAHRGEGSLDLLLERFILGL